MAGRTVAWSELKKRFTPEQIEEIGRRAEKMILEMNLRDVRESLGKTQEEVAALADVSQAELSRTERRADHLLSTLRRYIEALGGEVEVIARFGEKRIRLKGV